ncbi:G protein-coupled receptor, rhodopsin-like family and GPCR, rhodopsin-like, 7TM domain-containing protein [Strongyloides ratti]|uniref:G protein-coupled receptor, rhodopsin-like family and GPCR, rhodopsin-like, 7TM domain-containing protein n=1 Tax=Strongyloides ratti TaxID=34506 RepID=A0A090L6L2_STRRB|nr:G protein-coupled receptor, rhodopsin-like family and GPCR, rhodopsin-like, 7TM domain-containing protein [Strongyloides ratti]CEF63723.1 G protein-coupled receptor, rhodopsin-like family and GPCR, rhodopsin-like, 7TM domain-containing protein [Strongyloides ratti]
MEKIYDTNFDEILFLKNNNNYIFLNGNQLDYDYKTIVENINKSLEKYNQQPICGHTEEINLFRYLYTLFASFISGIGLLLNILMLWIFIKKLNDNKDRPYFYSTFLAILDCSICILFILIFGVDVFAGFNRIESLFIIYHDYIIIVFIISKITQLCIPYILILSTFERYAVITKKWSNSTFFTIKARILTLLTCILFCILLKIPSAFSIIIEEYPNCPNPFRKLAVDLSEFAKENIWYSFYDFQIMCLIQQVIPFITIIVFNLLIVQQLSINKKKQKSQTITETSCRANNVMGFALSHLQVLHYQNDYQLSQKIENAVYSTLAICFSYLICNGAHLILTILERTNSTLLIDKDDETKASLFYTTFGDAVSFMYMFTSAIRFVIYYKYNNDIKDEIIYIFTIFKENETIEKHLFPENV